ncbi:RagB/SusD family nutrient uptake outer membrane protein [Chitinophaga sp. 212800010-3]|uniref:RagB/SusD family nutrient uptake outer membrane protein n=1 Tax=unclassified Chitinophaga TaxID=2619133 RepID=UPI002DEDD96A|nr:RagB/SusD family nutrient uptake outer membrane protein [Chitinophaga sp. 212800010-3]
MQPSKYLLLMILLAATACTRLDEKLYNQVPVTDFGNNASEVNALVGPIYNTLKNYTLDDGSYMAMVELSSDMAVIPVRKGGDWWDGGAHKEMTMHKWTAGSTYYNNCYDNAMSSISICNQIFYQISNNPVIAAGVKEEILAEIRCVRAFWYYILCDNYGNVPVVTDFLDKTQPTTKSRKEVFNFIINELNSIKDKLRTDVATPASYGKMTRGAAYTLLAKMYLNAMVWNPDGGPKWEECKNACDSVMNMGYIIENNWKTNFVPQNDVSREAILSATFKAGGSGRQNMVAAYTLHYLDNIALGLLITPVNGIAAMPDYVRAFDTTDLRYRGSFLMGPMKDPKTGNVLITVHGRPLIHTIDITMHEVDADGWGWANQEEGVRCSKWDITPGLSTSMENDMHIFRLADIYLMKAEAIVRSGGDNAAATALVNRIRARAFTDPDKLLKSVTLDDIYKERRFELAWEGLERQDMIRFGKFLAPKPGFKPYTSDKKYLLFPIPQVDIDANNKLVQNPGY